MGQRYRQETREAIIMAQNPAPQLVINDIKAAISMIDNGYEWGNRELKRVGFRKLVDILLPADVDVELLLNRRELFIEQIEEVKNG